MGVPKFFRWMSERYPAISQLIAENRIPEFDCLYLDMNQIIHNCTHKDTDSVTFRMSEDEMFIAIFNYIEHLFGKIKPKELFFMAIDGVAPRAKMNQQRSRRFRTALAAEEARDKAMKEGLEMPTESPFDSNCITPGTGFMAKLTQQLKYFVSKKVTEDADWQNVEVILSGHEVPGEGEHKITEYIRQAKSQPGYNPNKRHCMYGLDADLIMLGLLSHDPHFCLLREEVTFGRAGAKKSKELEHQNFYLMHLCVVREYLELEFQQLKEPGAINFTYDLERVIDDFILMAFFVGNDFLPNLPHLHINEGALSLMFDTYKSILPKANGYINDGGFINFERLDILLKELSNVEFRFFEAENSDASWLKSKQKSFQEPPKPNKRSQLVISTPQRDIFKGVKKWVNASTAKSEKIAYNLPTSLAARDREFVKTLAENFHLEWNTIEDQDGNRHMQLAFPKALEADQNGDGEEDEEEEEEAQSAIFRVIKRYDNAKVVDVSADDAQEAMEKKYQEKFHGWKDEYYKSKLEWGLDDDEEMRKMTENYVQGLQWVLFYYYRGVASWPWYYGYHYSPMISDVRKGLGADVNFKLGQPFRPYQQLMGVLPDRSKTIVPEAYHDLMTNPISPIIDFYPRDFVLDMNGKKMEWEAVVKIPFIDEVRLLAAMKTKDHLLTKDEARRNEFGVTLKFSYSPDVNFVYPSSMPGVFNDISNCRCIENIFELPTMEGLKVFVGLIDGVKVGVDQLAGFPSLKVLPFGGALAHHGVAVFQQDSRNQSMILTLLDAEMKTKAEQAKERLGKVVHVGYPFLQEAKVTKVSDELFDYVLSNDGQSQPVAIPHQHYDISMFRKKAERIESVYSKRLGIVIGDVESMVHVEMLTGLLKTDKGDMRKQYGEIQGVETEYASQTVVDSVVSEDQRFLEQAALPIEEEFPIGARAFFLAEIAFGRPVNVMAHSGQDKVDIMVGMSKNKDDMWGRRIALDAERTTPYMPSYAIARQLSLNALALSKITSSFSINSSGLRLNLGLNLKFESKKQKVLGYSRRSDNGWEFSQKAMDLITQYMLKFPDFIAGLCQNPKGNEYNDTDFYPEDVAAQKVKEIGQWLKSIESKNFERVPLDANQLDSDCVAAIEQEADRRTALEASQPMETKAIKAAPRHALLKPADAEQRLAGQKFTVGDRVVYVQDSGKVPLALTGTVVGMTRTARNSLLDLLLDSPFMSGTTLGERCSAFRGATVSTTSVLNLTDRQVIAGTRASAARKPQSAPQPIYSNGHNYGVASGPNGHGRYTEASAPAQPVWGPSHSNGARNHSNDFAHRPRGGFDASRGQNSTPNPFTRGRAGRISTPKYTPMDNSDPSEGVHPHNPNFVAHSYTTVPPPASLDMRGRGRGRARVGMDRGFGRGRGRARGE